MSGIIDSIIKKSNYKLTQFSPKSINEIEKNVIEENGKIYIKCLVRNKNIKLTPEELIRQLYLYKLINVFVYPT